MSIIPTPTDFDDQTRAAINRRARQRQRINPVSRQPHSWGAVR